ncbi:cxxc5 family protein [Megaselia abdita]
MVNKTRKRKYSVGVENALNLPKRRTTRSSSRNLIVEEILCVDSDSSVEKIPPAKKVKQKRASVNKCKARKKKNICGKFVRNSNSKDLLCERLSDKKKNPEVAKEKIVNSESGNESSQESSNYLSAEGELKIQKLKTLKSERESQDEDSDNESLSSLKLKLRFKQEDNDEFESCEEELSCIERIYDNPDKNCRNDFMKSIIIQKMTYDGRNATEDKVNKRKHDKLDVEAEPPKKMYVSVEDERKEIKEEEVYIVFEIDGDVKEKDVKNKDELKNGTDKETLKRVSDDDEEKSNEDSGIARDQSQTSEKDSEDEEIDFKCDTSKNLCHEETCSIKDESRTSEKEWSDSKKDKEQDSSEDLSTIREASEKNLFESENGNNKKDFSEDRCINPETSEDSGKEVIDTESFKKENEKQDSVANDANKNIMQDFDGDFDLFMDSDSDSNEDSELKQTSEKDSLETKIAKDYEDESKEKDFDLFMDSDSDSNEDSELKQTSEKDSLETKISKKEDENKEKDFDLFSNNEQDSSEDRKKSHPSEKCLVESETSKGKDSNEQNQTPKKDLLEYQTSKDIEYERKEMNFENSEKEEDSNEHIEQSEISEKELPKTKTSKGKKSSEDSEEHHTSEKDLLETQTSMDFKNSDNVNLINDNEQDSNQDIEENKDVVTSKDISKEEKETDFIPDILITDNDHETNFEPTETTEQESIENINGKHKDYKKDSNKDSGIFQENNQNSEKGDYICNEDGKNNIFGSDEENFDISNILSFEGEMMSNDVIPNFGVTLEDYDAFFEEEKNNQVSDSSYIDELLSRFETFENDITKHDSTEEIPPQKSTNSKSKVNIISNEILDDNYFGPDKAKISEILQKIILAPPILPSDEERGEEVGSEEEDEIEDSEESSDESTEEGEEDTESMCKCLRCCVEKGSSDEDYGEDNNKNNGIKKKRKRCGVCTGCQIKDNCGECAPCVNERSHGMCKQRICEKLSAKKPIHHVPEKRQMVVTYIKRSKDNFIIGARVPRELGKDVSLAIRIPYFDEKEHFDFKDFYVPQIEEYSKLRDSVRIEEDNLWIRLRRYEKYVNDPRAKDKVVCKLCDDAILSNSAIVSHIIGKHWKIRLFDCAYCSVKKKSFVTYSSLRAHIEYAHL